MKSTERSVLLSKLLIRDHVIKLLYSSSMKKSHIQ